jgi:hypothetical protein
VINPVALHPEVERKHGHSTYVHGRHKSINYELFNIGIYWLWETRKEILGWVFDGARRCIELPPGEKINKITSEIRTVTRKESIPRKRFEKLRGRLRQDCIGIPTTVLNQQRAPSTRFRAADIAREAGSTRLGSARSKPSN